MPGGTGDEGPVETDRDGEDDEPDDRLPAAADRQPQSQRDHGWTPVSVLTLPSRTTTSRSA
jgi:hypothetical protein